MEKVTIAVSAEGRVRSMAKCKNCNNLYNLSDDNDVIVGKWCPKVNDSPHVEIERECEYYKRMTQADRIRSMSDEELAGSRVDRIDFYTKSDIPEYIGDFAGIANSIEEAISLEIKWLQSEVEEIG